MCLPAALPASLSWDQVVEKPQVLRAHGSRVASRGAPRTGAAWLQGLVFCGRWGRTMGIQPSATREKRAPAYPW